MRKGGPVGHDRRIPGDSRRTGGVNTPGRPSTGTMRTGGNTPPTTTRGTAIKTPPMSTPSKPSPWRGLAAAVGVPGVRARASTNTPATTTRVPTKPLRVSGPPGTRVNATMSTNTPATKAKTPPITTSTSTRTRRVVKKRKPLGVK